MRKYFASRAGKESRPADRGIAEAACESLEGLVAKSKARALGRAATYFILEPWKFAEHTRDIIAGSPFISPEGEVTMQYPWARFVVQAANNQFGYRQSKAYVLMGGMELDPNAQSDQQNVAFGYRYLIDANERRGAEQEACPYAVRAYQTLQARPGEGPDRLATRMLVNLLPNPNSVTTESVASCQEVCALISLSQAVILGDDTARLA